MNVILIVTDTFRRDHLPCYGNAEVITPNLDRFAEQALIFEDCYAASFPYGSGARRLDDRALYLCLSALGTLATR